MVPAALGIDGFPTENKEVDGAVGMNDIRIENLEVGEIPHRQKRELFSVSIVTRNMLIYTGICIKWFYQKHIFYASN